MDRRREAFYLDDEEVDNIRERSLDDEREEKAHGRQRGPYSDSEFGKKASDKRKGSPHEMRQGRRLPR